MVLSVAKVVVLSTTRFLLRPNIKIKTEQVAQMLSKQSRELTVGDDKGKSNIGNRRMVSSKQNDTNINDA